MTEYQKAVTKYVRISARKARLAADIIRGLNVEKALVQLRVSPLKAAKLLIRTLESAIANAVMQMEAKRENLKIVEVKIDVGPTLKRAVPRSRGSKNPILKRSSHFTVIVGEE
jgi:large subunit ribosomal protein L22